MHGYPFAFMDLADDINSLPATCMGLHSCPIVLLFSSCLLYDISNWKGHLLNPKNINNQGRGYFSRLNFVLSIQLSSPL